MEFLLQLLAELVTNNEEETTRSLETEVQLSEAIDGTESSDFFNLMHFH